MTKSEFNNILWPKEFYIEFKNGEKQLFVSSQGIEWSTGCNESGGDENRANLNLCWKKKSPSQQKYRLIQVWVDEIQAIELVNGAKIWSTKT